MNLKKKKKTIRKIKRIISVPLGLCLLFSGVLFFLIKIENLTLIASTPERTTKEFFESFKNADFVKSNEFLDDTLNLQFQLDKENEISLRSYSEENSILDNKLSDVYSKMEIEIIDVEINNNKSTVNVLLKYKDISEFLLNQYEIIAKEQFEKSNSIHITNKDLLNSITSEIDGKNAEAYGQFYLERVDNRWIIIGVDSIILNGLSLGTLNGFEKGIPDIYNRNPRWSGNIEFEN